MQLLYLQVNMLCKPNNWKNQRNYHNIATLKINVILSLTCIKSS